MNLLNKVLLITHVITGLLAIVAYYAVWFDLIKKDINIGFLKKSSLYGFVLFLLSCITVGYYYALYYGNVVKPIIKTGPYPWAHTIFMEFKEHIFLFIPFLALVVTLCFFLLENNIKGNKEIKQSITYLSAIIVFLSTIITFSGIIISGAVR